MSSSIDFSAKELQCVADNGGKDTDMSRFMSLDDLRRRDAEEGGGGQELYSGGADGRGGGSSTNVLGPPGGHGGAPPGFPPNMSHSDMLEALVRQAARAQQEDGNTDPAERQASITIYANGFQVDEGDFRSTSEPENQEFLQTLLRGRVPPALGISGNVDVSLIDKRPEEYKAPAYVAFSGEGFTLSSSSAESSSQFTPDDIEDGIADIDESAPTTLIQVRLSSKKKIRVKLNHSSTVKDLLRHIKAQGGAVGPFTLSSGFPPTNITTVSQTIAEAGLIGAAVIQN
jgi:UBX domain-containing protein 1